MTRLRGLPAKTAFTRSTHNLHKQTMTPPDRPSPSLVFLVGFMGSGKTTVGRALATLMGWHFVDLDQVIEAREGRSIREIFETRGEAEFRRIEHEALAVCGEMNETVIALGGG